MRTFLSPSLLAGILAAGVALAAVLFAKEERRVRDDERDRADRAAFVLEQTVATTALSLRGVAASSTRSEGVERGVRAGTPAAVRPPAALSGVGWMPRVPGHGARLTSAAPATASSRAAAGAPQRRRPSVHLPDAAARSIVARRLESTRRRSRGRSWRRW